MATTYQITGLRKVVAYTTLSVSTDQSNTVIYDASTVLSNLQTAYPGLNIISGAAGSLDRVFASISCASATTIAQLSFDATTPLPAMNIPVNTNPTDSCFESFGGLQNTAVGTAGFTGNITLTTTGISASALITIVLEVIVGANILHN